MDNRVFICYSRKDEDFVLKLAAKLKNQGVPIWLDQWDIPSGANWSRTIEKALTKSNCLLLILSPSSVESDEVQCEWLSAIDARKTVIPILCQPCQIPIRLKLIQYIDFTCRNPDDKGLIEKILNALGTVMSIPAQSLEQVEHNSANASNLLDKSLEYDPARASEWLDEGLALYNNDKYNNAIEAFDKAIELNPNLEDAWTYKAYSHYSQDEWDEAIKAFDKVTQLNRNSKDAWTYMGFALKKLERIKEADVAFNKAKELGYTGEFYLS